VCTLLIAWRCLDDADFVVAANRDELVGRPSAPPGRLHDNPPIYGGRDLLAGGTWLAVTPDARLAAVTNRRGDERDEVWRDPDRRSRGELPALLLRGGRDARAVLEQVRPADYNPFNVVLLDARSAFVGHGAGGDHLEVVELQPGAHVLCVHDLDTKAHIKERRIHLLLSGALRDAYTASEAADAMTAILRDHATGTGDVRDAVCIHGEQYGTVSASVVVGSASRASYRHASGRPCVTHFAGVEMS
jgi:uncharacterized protein with NRDE domain